MLGFHELPFNCYSLLQVTPQDSTTAITQRYRELLGKQFEKKTSHEVGARQEQARRELWFAYLVLSNPERRAAYDQFLKG